MTKRLLTLLGLSIVAAGLLAACAAEPAPDANPETNPEGITVGEPNGENPGEDVPLDPAGAMGPDASEYAAIYAAAIRQLYTVDHTFGDAAPNWPTIYIASQTDDSVSGEEALTEGMTLDAGTQDAIAEALADLPAEIVWVGTREDVPVSEEDGLVEGGEAVVVTLGNVHVTDEDTVEVPASLYCGMLCATGMTYVIEQVDGVWQVTGTTGPIWMS